MAHKLKHKSGSLVGASCKATRTPRVAATARRRRRLRNRKLKGGSSSSIWWKPKKGRLKLNFDGSSRHASRRASIGGVYRDHQGGFVLGYAEPIGKAMSSVAELAALRRGLELALENSWRNISVEGDIKMVVDVVKSRARFRSKEDLEQCRRITALPPRLGKVAVTHARRERNMVAHGFAKLGHKAAARRVWRHVPPGEVLVHLRRDAKSKG